MEEESRNRCPNCGSGNIAKIIWGLPDFTEELQKRIDAGEIVSGFEFPSVFSVIDHELCHAAVDADVLSGDKPCLL